MRHIVITSEALPHQRYFAQAQAELGNKVSLYTTMPKRMVKNFPDYKYHFVPGPAVILRGVTRNRIKIPRFLYDMDGTFFDKVTSVLMEKSDMVYGAATSCAITAREAKRRGSKFVLDRACPDIRFQEALCTEEAKKLGGEFIAAPKWFLERQLEEYDLADYILAPSEYSKRYYPDELRKKVVIARLFGKFRAIDAVPEPASDNGRPFTVGIVGGQALRKGYLYLLQAWKQLGWKDARLLIRTDVKQLRAYPVLAALLDELPNVEVIQHVPDISAFFRQLDVYIQPSVDEGFGMAIVEAIGQGVPAIVSTNCGAGEFLKADDEVLKVEPFSPLAIMDSLTQMRDDPQKRHAMAVNGLKAVQRENNNPRLQYNVAIEEMMRHAFN